MLKPYLKGEIIISAVVFFGSILLFWETRKFEGLAVYGRLGPEYWPRFLLVLMMVISVFIAASTVNQVRKGYAKPGLQGTFDTGTMRLFLAIGLIVFYISFMRVFGFLTLTPFLMIAFMYLLGERSKFWMIFLSLFMPILIVLLFTKVMYVPLPRGMGIFLKISHLIY